MDFPLVDLVDHDRSRIWLRQHFHPDGLQCPRCGAGWREAYRFRRTKSSQLQVWRCKECVQTYTLYSGTVFEGGHLPPAKVVLLLRRTCQQQSGMSSGSGRMFGAPLRLILQHRIQDDQQLQGNAALLQPESSVPSDQTETDEMFQNAGEKGDPHRDPADPPRREANKARGHGTYENDLPPVVGTVGRTSGQVRLRVLRRTDGERLCPHVHGSTGPQATVYTDELKGYNQVERNRQTVCRGEVEWARDEDGDGIREVHINTIEGLWTTLRNFLRPFRGVHKKHLAGYVAICEFAINLKRITPSFISALVHGHDF